MDLAVEEEDLSLQVGWPSRLLLVQLGGQEDPAEALSCPIEVLAAQRHRWPGMRWDGHLVGVVRWYAQICHSPADFVTTEGEP